MIDIEGRYRICPMENAFLWVTRDRIILPPLRFDNEEMWRLSLITTPLSPNDMEMEISNRLETTTRALYGGFGLSLVKRGLGYGWYVPDKLMMLDPDKIPEFLSGVSVDGGIRKIYLDWFLIPLTPLLDVAHAEISRFLSAIGGDVEFDGANIKITIPERLAELLDLTRIKNTKCETKIYLITHLGTTKVWVKSIHTNKREERAMVFLLECSPSATYWVFEGKDVIELLIHLAQEETSKCWLRFAFLDDGMKSFRRFDVTVSKYVKVGMRLLDAENLKVGYPDYVTERIKSMWLNSIHLSTISGGYYLLTKSIERVDELIRKFFESKDIPHEFIVQLPINLRRLLFYTSSDLAKDLMLSWASTIELLRNA